jgi:hypothetical protein
MQAVRDIAARPLVAAGLCSLLALPARAVGHEAAQAFRRVVDRIVSWSDTLFALVARSDAAFEAVRQIQAWGAWVVYGLVSAALAMLVTRWLAGRPLPWASVAIVLLVWIGVRAFVWDWDDDLRFALTRFRVDAPMTYGPWPHAGTAGFFAGFAAGLVLVAMPWRKVS